MARPALLGESPVWDTERQRLYFVDSLKKQIINLCADGSDVRVWTLPDIVGSIGLADDGRLIAGLGNGFALIDLSHDRATITRIGDPEPHLAETRLNDGKVDRKGRFWCGSMSKDRLNPVASLYRLEPDHSWTRVETGITVSNGIAFSPNSTRMYFSDSRVDRSYQYDLELESGTLSHCRPFADTTTYEGRIDGATVDEDGNYWGALFDGSAVGCFDSSGQLRGSVPLPVRCPTMCSFGGPDMDVLFVTSATFLMSPEEIALAPQAGALFAIRGLGARGIAEPRFRILTKPE
nr:SMP-30/gluconolactonase/LRE family protein [Marinicella sp. W31]MDC2875637.1 SMP-30/gluconolactonase/LRE family protein [Marinicella sp. W31]